MTIDSTYLRVLAAQMGLVGMRGTTVPWYYFGATIASVSPGPGSDTRYTTMLDNSAPSTVFPGQPTWFYYGYFEFYILNPIVGAPGGNVRLSGWQLDRGGTLQAINLYDANATGTGDPNQPFILQSQNPQIFSYFSVSANQAGAGTSALTVYYRFHGFRYSAY